MAPDSLSEKWKMVNRRTGDSISRHDENDNIVSRLYDLPIILIAACWKRILLIYFRDVPYNLGTLKHDRKVFKVRSRRVGLRRNHRIKMIDSEKVVYGSAFECGADRLDWGGAVHFVNISQNQARCSTARQNGLRNTEHLRRK
jgi:hypothetical protein